MDRNAIISEINRWQSQYNAYKQKIAQTESDIGQLEYLNGKLSDQLNNFQGYVQKRRNRISLFSYLTSASRIASRFISGMSDSVNGAEVRNIAGNLNNSINHISNQIRKLASEVETYRANMNKCAQNYNYWRRQLQIYDQQNSANN